MNADQANPPTAATQMPHRHGASDHRETDSGWRRTDEGWWQTEGWTVSSSRTEQTSATEIHPSLIAMFVLLVSAGALLAFEPVIRRRRKHPLKSDQMLIQNWAQRLRRQAVADETDCL